MADIEDTEANWMLALERATQAGPRLIQGAAELDRACDHIVRPLRDAVLLYCDGSWPSAAFFAITALEEMAKTHIGMFRRAQQSAQTQKRGNDPFYNHKDKHLLAASPTVPMRARLPRVLEDKRVKDPMELASSGASSQFGSRAYTSTAWPATSLPRPRWCRKNAPGSSCCSL